ncbi:AbgT family transporter [Brevibacillus humidisoli]|uniref:AbgT family transporter n=1 Tax=Brevibacillus humidisoli TaxID=2895522 RepID=UPI001E619753|nr:AbgT family transporter [Brevibacillus humidisoli]UFJ39601.1 AbgT family transporter [Brevibacillus humidisoli]
MANHMTELNPSKQNGQKGFLKWVEVVGNKLPHPFMLFLYLALGMMVLSAILASFGVTVVHPGKGETIAVKSLLSTEGFHWILTSMLTNFTGFKPLGLVLAMALGIGLAERVGLIQAILRKMILKVPARIVTFTVVFSGILGNLASDAAFVIIPPLGAMVFLALGRHPLAGLAAGFAGVGSGFTANIFVAGTDALLSGISTEVAKTIDPNVAISPLANWYFMVFSTLFLSLLGTWITEKIVEPRLGQYSGNKTARLENLTETENKALRATGMAAAIFLVILALLVVPEGAILRDPEQGTIIPSPFLKGIIPIILLFFVTVATTFGIKTGQIKSQKDVPRFMTDAIKDMSSFIVMVFAAAQFIAFFNWSNVGVYIAVNGAELLTSINLTGLPVVVGFTLLAALLNLFIFSGSAQWALMAPVFIPMFMLLDYHPAFIQLAYRIADSSTNTISPLNPYMPMILMYMQEYKKEAGLGTLISMMMPYAMIFLTMWTVLMIVWYLFGLPLGPGVSM